MNSARSALVLAIFGALVVVSMSHNSEGSQKNSEDDLDRIGSSVENIRQSDKSKENRALANMAKCFFPHGPHPHQEDCSKWYLCLFWRATEMTCRRNQLFDTRLLTCRTSFLVNCGNRKNPYAKQTTVRTTAKTTTAKPTTIKLTTQNLITDEITDSDHKTTKNDDNSDITTSSESSKETTLDSDSSEEKSTTDSNKSKSTDSGEDISSTSESKEKTSTTDSDDKSPITPDSREIDLTTESDKSPATSDSKEEILTTESNADNTATVSISETSLSTETELRPETRTDSIIASTTDITQTNEDIHPTTPEKPNCDEEANKDVSDWFACPTEMGHFGHPFCENLFIFCEDNKPFVKKCATGLKFSLEFLVCVWDENDYFI